VATPMTMMMKPQSVRRWDRFGGHPHQQEDIEHTD